MKKLLLILTFASIIANLSAQSIEQQYKNADNYANKYNSLQYGLKTTPEWISDSDNFWYAESDAKGVKYMIVDAKAKTKKQLFNSAKMIKAIFSKTGKNIEIKDFMVSDLVVNKDLSSVAFSYDNHYMSVSLADYTVSDFENIDVQEPKPIEFWSVTVPNSKERVLSPDKLMEAYISEGNLFVKNIKSGKAKRLSIDGAFNSYYSSDIQWSPDSKKIVTTKYMPVDIRQVTLIQSTPDFQFQPYVYSIDYVKPGDALPFNYPVLFNLENGTQTNIEFDEPTRQYSLDEIEWKSDSESFTFHYNQRGHQQYIVYRVDVKDGKADKLINETADTFIRYSEDYYKLLDSRNEVLWISERDGWRHLYQIDYNTGEIKRQLSKGEWFVKSVADVNEKEGFVILAVKGITKGIDPYLTEYYRVDLNTGDMICLTPEEGNHVAQISKDDKYLIDTWSKVDQAPQTVLRSTKDGKIIMNISKTDISKMLKEGYVLPEPFMAKGRDGETDIWGIIIRPKNFDKNKKYPVIEYIYAGPHNSFVPKSFGVTRYANLTELGFIVVQVDGMGTFNRSRKFHDVAWRNLKDAGFPDRIGWIKQAADKYPEMDLDKVGVYGFSAGGQSTALALLLHGDFYKVGYAAVGCYDNRMDKIWWNEQWMGYPIGKWYEESSAITYVDNLEGKLMIAHGEFDDNVDPSSTFQFVDALIKANKEFEFVMLTDVRHTEGGVYGERKRRDFFVKNLLNKETPNWNKIK